ncbi:MAG: Gar1/Naf1 family protein [Candidatus Bathyarchaeota archaeon]
MTATQRIGEVLHRSKTGKLIVRLQAEARIGQPVLDKRGKRVGQVFDIFGPVTAPYASIRMKDDETGQPDELYLGDRAERGPRPKKRRQKR